ncbi:MAG: D-alanyl-D-alanine endopeptidase [Massilia sp.]|jgi:D-alanyl-D-alanine endopeptidase (penicillin-binding protein 7)|nr:D-alanyl-D-alanine endopeptidase [Massilia sp.]MDB5949852.1 D-alanyl-D-alanine endopeptidase [Massilia sp.]
MYKLALGALVSLLFILTPASAAKAEGGGHTASAKKHVVKKAAVRRRAQVGVASADRARVVRHVGVVRGKRVVTYRNVRSAHPLAAAAARSAGDVAGLNLTRDPLALASNVALVLDQSNSEILFEKNANVALPIASITKLMTGLVVVLAQQDMHEVLTVTEDDVDHEKHTSSRLRVGARMTRGDLLHIALMSSENRAASALGRNYPGGITAFVAAMNAKAAQLGMNDTRYVDSSGLSSRNVASARDLAKLAMVAHQEPLLREYSTDPKYQVDAGGRIMHYSNTNYLVASPDWQIGLQKTGFINEAGRCLVMQAMIQGRAVIMVFLDSKGKQSRTADAGRMRRWLEALKPPAVG